MAKAKAKAGKAKGRPAADARRSAGGEAQLRQQVAAALKEWLMRARYALNEITATGRAMLEEIEENPDGVLAQVLEGPPSELHAAANDASSADAAISSLWVNTGVEVVPSPLLVAREYRPFTSKGGK